MAENKQSTLILDEIFSSTTTEASPTETKDATMILDEIFAPSEPINTKDDSGLVQFAGASKEHSTVEDAPAVVEETSVDLADVQRTLAKDKAIAAATAPQTPEVTEGFKMPKVDLTKTTTEQSADNLAGSSSIVKGQIGSLLAPKQQSIVEADFRDFTSVLPYTAEDGSIRNYEDQKLDKATIRSFFHKDKDGAYQLPNGKTIYSDALFEQFVDDYYKRYNHPILMQDENYRKDYIMRNFGKTEEQFITDATAKMNAQLDSVETAYEQTRPKDDDTKVYPYTSVGTLNKQPAAVSKSLSDLRKKINSISKDNFWSGFNESFDIDDMLSLGIPSLGTAINQLSALNKYVNGEELTPEENLYVQLNMLSQQIDQFRGEYRNDNGLSMNRVGNIVGFMPQFATQIGISSKIAPQIGAKVVKDITLKGVANAMKESASEGLKMGLKKVSASMADDIIATPLMTATHQAFADRRLGHYAWEGEELVKEKSPWAVDYLKALGETFVERHSEQMGEWITGGLRYGGKRLAQTKLLDNAFGRSVSRALDYKLPPVLEQARKNLRVSGYIGEVASEIYANAINPVFIGETDSWKELLSGRYYWDLLTSIAISTGSFYSLAVPDYIRQGRSIKQLDNSRAKLVSSISNQPLKDVLQTAFASDNLEVGINDLASIDWKNISTQDAKAATEYIFDTLNSKLLQSEVVEAERLQAFLPVVEGVTSSLYSGGSVLSPKMGTELQVAELKDGNTAFLVWGDINDAEATQFVVKGANGELNTINREDIGAVKPIDMSDYLAEQYSLMFSDSINKERLTNFLQDLNTAQQNNTSPEAINKLYDRSGYVLFGEGENVTLTDGSVGVVVGYHDGKYDIADPTNPEIVTTVGFLNILQPNTDVATAQVELTEEISNGSIEVDAAVEESFVSEEDILRQKLESAAEQLSTADGTGICVIRLRDGREAIVKQGVVVMNEDNSVDTDNSSATIVIKDTESNTTEQIGIDEVESIIEELDAQEAIDAVQSNIEEQIAKRNLIAKIFEEVGAVDVILTSGTNGKITEILTDETYTFNWVGEDKQLHGIAITLDQVAEVLPPKEESAPTEDTTTTEEVAVELENSFDSFTPTPINLDKVDWDHISAPDYINLSVLAYGPAETLSRSRTYYLKTKEKIEEAQKRVNAQQDAIAKLKLQYADLAGPGEAVKLDKKVKEAEDEKANKVAVVTELEQRLAMYARAMGELGINIMEEVDIIDERKGLETRKAELVEADANLDKFAAEGSADAVNTIVNNEANRNRIYNLYVSRGLAPDQANVTSAILWDIVTGNIHLRWADYKNPAGNVEKGLSSELGLTNSAADQRTYKAVLDKGGVSVDTYVHWLWERMDGYSNNLDDMEIKDEVLSVLQSTPNGTAALQTLYDALGVEDAIEESYSMNKAEIAQQIADIDKQIAENAVAQAEFNNKIQNRVEQLEGKEIPTVAYNIKSINDNQPAAPKLSEQQVSEIIEAMQRNAELAPMIELSPENWRAEFGEDGVVNTPIGDVKIGDNQYLKLAQRGRDGKLGMIKPTLTRPDVIIEEESSRKDGQIAERNSSFVFVKAFTNAEGTRDYMFTSVTILRDGKEVVISNQEKETPRIKRLLKEGTLAYINKATLPSESTTSAQGDQSTIPGGVSYSENKDTTNISENQENQQESLVDSTADMIADESSAPQGVDKTKWDALIAHLREILGVENVVTDINIIRAVYDYVTGKIGKSEAEAILGDKNFRLMAAPISNIFYSDAEQAVEEIKQEKATPQQWLAMLQKNGGLKAGEDKWIGLSDWLKASDKKALTKQEVLDYIRANKIQIEEVQYGQSYIYGSAEFEALQKEYDTIRQRIIKDKHEAHEKLSNELIDKYGFADNTVDMDALNDDDYSELNELNINEWQAADMAWQELVDKYGDDFEIAFSQSGYDIYIDNNDAASSILGLSDNYKDINKTRLIYTTEGLSNKREIALTVPTIESWKENDEIHFGDADNGRAVAWIRFGETTVPREVEVVREAVLDTPFKAYNGHDIYRVKDTNGKHFIIYGKLKNGQMMYVPQINGKYIGETVETAAFETLEQAQEALAAYYKAHPIRKTINERILVIDEIQSNRHQEGRKLGYESKEDKAALDAIIAAREDLGKEQRDFEYRTGQAWQRWQNGEISEQEYNEMWNTQFDAENKALRAKQEAIDAQLSEYKKNKKPGVIPAAPFESNWAELAMKRMLRYAADNGYDKVAWTTGAQQAERYSLNNYFSSVSRWDINTDDMPGRYYTLNGSTKIGINVNEDGQIISASLDELVGKPLSDVVGKEVASKMMEMEDRSSLEDIEFQIGGEGMKAFYDKMLVSFMNKYGKKWGARVGEVTMPELDDNKTMHSVDVTPAMRESVMQGQPMFRNFKTRQGEVYGFTYNGKIYLDPTKINMEAPIHEYTELWSTAVADSNPKLWERGKDLLKQTTTWDIVNSDPNYRNLSEDLRASETLSRIVAAETAKKMGEVTDDKTLIAKLRKWIRDMWNALKKTFSQWSEEDLSKLTLKEFKTMPLRDFVDKVDVRQYLKGNNGLQPSMDKTELEEIRKERAQIEEQAKANGTWLKAPNGQPTNLTPEQWVTVHTRRFKEWFGDWEKAGRIEKLRRSSSIYFNGEEYKGKYVLTKESAKKYIKEQLNGEYTNADTNDKIRVSNKGANKVTSHGYNNPFHLATVAYIPTLIENSIFITELPNTKGKNEFESYRYYLAGVNIAGEEYTAKIVVGVRNGKTYYDHDLSSIEKGKLIDSIGSVPTELAKDQLTSLGVKDTRYIEILQINSSKIVDANGEPKVVYHGTPNDFTVFDKEKRGSSTDRGIWGNGFYFSASSEYADTYAKRNGVEGQTMPLFLNMRNPLFISLKNGGNEGAMYFNSLQQKYFTDDVYEDIYKVEENMARAQKELSNEIVSNGYDGIIIEYSHPTIEDEYVTFEPNQIKFVDNTGYFDPHNDDIRYTLCSEENSLVAIHNISGAKLAKALKQGGLANPSAAVIDIARQSHEGYGEYSFILPKDLVAKKSGKNLGTYDRDAWTPLYPTVIYSQNKTSKANLNKLVEGLDEGLADKIKREVMMKIEGNGFYSGLQIVFLKDKGIELPIATVTPRYAGTIEDLQKLFGDKEVTYDNYKALDQDAKNAVTIWIKARGNKADIERIKGLMEQWSHNPKLIKTYTEEVGYGQFDNLLYGLQADARNSGNPDYGKTIENAVEYIRENNLQDEFDAWETAIISNLGFDEKIQVGWSPSGDRIMRKNTLENVSAYMRKQGKNASSDHWSNSEGKMLAKLAQNFATLEQIRANKHRLLSDVDATMEIRRRMNQAAQIFMDFSKNSNLFLEEQSAYAYLEDILIGGMNPDKVVAEYNKATKRNISLTEEQKAELNELREDMNNIPVQYFETKFDRPVMFNEFVAVVAPDTMPESIEKQLRDAGLAIYKYNPDVEGDRREQTLKATASDSIRFMVVAPSTDASQTPPATAKEKSLQNKVEELRAQLKDNKKNLNSTLLRVYELLVSPEVTNAMETGIGKLQYRSVVKSVRTAIEQSYGKKDLAVVQKIVDKYLHQVQDVMSLLLSRRRLSELTQILNTSVEGYTPQGVRLGKRIDDKTREVFKVIREALAESYTPELVERHYEEGTKLVRKPVQYRLRKLTVDGVDINTDFRLKTKNGGIIADLRDKADDIIASYGDVPSSEDTMKASRYLYVANVLESYDEALSLNSAIGEVTDEINKLDERIKELSAAHREAPAGTERKTELWDGVKALRLSKDAAIENRVKLRQQYAARLNTFIQTLEALIDKGVNDLKLEQGNRAEEELNFRRGIYRSIKNPSVQVLANREYDKHGQKKPRQSVKKFRRKNLNENLFLGTFAELSKELDITSIPGSWLEDGWYNQFMLSEDGYIYRSDWRYNEQKRIQEKIDDKVRSIFAKSTLWEKFKAQSTNPMNIIAYEAQAESGYTINRLATQVDDKGQAIGGFQENVPLTIANLLYIRNTVRQPGGKSGYVAWGISETTCDRISAYVEEKYPEYCQFADWVVNDLLPELYEMQDSIYFKRFNTHLTKTPFYFPIVRDKRFVGRPPEVGEGEVTIPSSVTGNIVERVKTSAKMDLSADMFSVLNNHIKETLDWCAYSELTRKFNMFSTSRNFRNILDAQDFSVDKLKETYEIAIGQSKMRNADDGLSQTLNSVSKTLVAGNIVFNFNAAIKQVISGTAILGYSADPKFMGLWLKNYFSPSFVNYGVKKILQMIQKGTINPTEALDAKVFFDNWRWAIKNIPTMRARWEGGKAGFEVFKAEGVARWDKVTNWITEVGLKPNAFVDMITCANGTRTVYEYQYARNIKQGMSKDEAHKDACVKAAVLINETQQSSLDGFLSSFQSGGGIARLLGTGLGAYQNTSMAFARNEFYSLESIFRMMRASNRTRMIDFKTEEYRNRGYAYDKANEMANNEFKWQFAAQVSSFLHNAIISNYVWLMATPLSAIVANLFVSIGDEEERKKFWHNEAVRKQFAEIFTLESLAWQAPLLYNHPISKQLLTFAQKLRRGENFSGNIFESPVTAEIEDLLSAISKQWIGVVDAETEEVERKEPIKAEQTVEYIVWACLLKTGTALSQRIISNIADGIQGMIEDGVDTEDIMNILNSPRALTRAIAGEPREGENQKEYLDRMSYVYRMVNAGSGEYDSKWQKERTAEYIRKHEQPLYEAMGIDPLEVKTLEAHKKSIVKGLMLQSAGKKVKVKANKVGAYNSLTPTAQKYQVSMYTLSTQIKALEQRLETMVEFDSERSELLQQKYNLEKELYNKWQQFIKL